MRSGGRDWGFGDRVSGVGARLSGVGGPASGFACVLLGLLLANPLAGQSTQLVVVTGLGGSPAYSERFARWGSELRRAALAAGVPEGNVVWLAEDGPAAPGVDGPARLERVVREIAALDERAGPDDLVVIALFGHGSARGGETRVNLPGPDLSATELASLLEPLAPRRVVVVNAASASGGFIEPLAASGRVVITATRSPREAEATRFGGHFVEALAGDGADTDKDGRVSFLEAFEFARREVAREFAAAGHLPTEHALLDDDGDGRGTLEPTGNGDGDGQLAARLALAPLSTVDATPRVASLRERQAELRAELDALRARRDSMESAAYDAELERLLLEIARTGRAIREAEDSASGTPGGGR